MRILFFGYGEMGCAGFEFLSAAGEEIAAVATHRDDPAERRWYRSLAELAAARGVPVHFGEDLGEAGLVELARRTRPELILSFYYRSLIPMTVIAEAPRGGLNLHGSLLPRLRGRAPLNWALVEGEERTGVTLHHMTAKADAGDIVAQQAFPIGPRDTALDLFRRAVEEARLLLREIWPRVREGTAPRIPQDHSRATYRGRRTPEDGRIDWTRPARKIDGLVRAVTEPFPGAFTFLDGRKLMVWAGAPVGGSTVGPAAGSGGPGSGPRPGGVQPGEIIGESLVAAGEGAFRIERCEFADRGDPRPVLRVGTKLG